MSSVSTELQIPPELAFSVLEDPRSYERLVAGARRIRRFDSRWPEPGTRIHHTVGLPPLLIRDHTEVLECDPPRRLLLDAHIWPFGALTVEFLFERRGTGSLLTVREEPQSGPVSWGPLRQGTRLVVALRNREMCRRYRRLAAARAEAAASA
jgi:hypothetical protein